MTNKTDLRFQRLFRRTGSSGGGGGVTVHGALSGLGADDHPHYLTQARGDSRYSQLGHSHPNDIYFPGSTPIAFSSAEPNTSTINQIGGHFNTGSFVTQLLANTNIVTQEPAVVIVSGGTTIDSISGMRTRARVTTTKPFRYSHVFSLDSNPLTSAHRFFSGLSTRLTQTDVNPSTLTNIVGIGYDSADTQWQFMTNNGTGSATKVPLGVSFPKPTVRSATLWRVELLFDGITVFWKLTDLATNTGAEGTITTDLPNPSEFLGMDAWISAGGVVTQSRLIHSCDYLIKGY